MANLKLSILREMLVATLSEHLVASLKYNRAKSEFDTISEQLATHVRRLTAIQDLYTANGGTLTNDGSPVESENDV